MTTQYAELRAVLAKLDVARDYHNRRAAMNIGAISGGLDMCESARDMARLATQAEDIVRNEIARGCRISHLEAIVRNFGGSRVINDLISDAMFARLARAVE